MLKSIRLVNFFSFKDTTIELNRGVNVLIGINGSGKSNFFRLFDMLLAASNGQGLRRYILELGGVNEVLFQGERENDDITIELVFDESDNVAQHYKLDLIPTQTNYFVKEKFWSETEGSNQVHFERNGQKITLLDDAGKNGESTVNETELYLFNLVEPQLSDIKNVFSTTVYNIDTTSKSTLRKPTLAIPETHLAHDGSNLASVLNTIKTNNKKGYQKIIQALQNVNPYFDDFDFRPFGTNFEMLLAEKGLNRAVHLSKVSDGTLRYICLITALLSTKPIICIDEPETGLHPDMLLNIAEAVIEAGENATVIISTHSATFLNYFDLDQVRVFEKDEQNATQIYAYTASEFSSWKENYQLAALWRQGFIGGNRYGN